jgi:hypothetical protein
MPCFSWYANETFSAGLIAIGEAKGRDDLTIVARIVDNRLSDVLVKEFPVTLPGNGRPSAAAEFQYDIPAQWLESYFFLELSLMDRSRNVLARNAYWLRVTSYLADEKRRKQYRTIVQPMPAWKQGPWLEPQLAGCPTALRAELAAAFSRDSHGVAHGAMTIRNVGPKPAFPLRITTSDPRVCLLCSDNYFWLRAGEQRQIQLTLLLDSTTINPCFPVSPSPGVSLSISAWNVAGQVMRVETPTP